MRPERGQPRVDASAGRRPVPPGHPRSLAPEGSTSEALQILRRLEYRVPVDRAEALELERQRLARVQERRRARDAERRAGAIAGADSVQRASQLAKLRDLMLDLRARRRIAEREEAAKSRHESRWRELGLTPGARTRWGDQLGTAERVRLVHGAFAAASRSPALHSDENADLARRVQEVLDAGPADRLGGLGCEVARVLPAGAAAVLLSDLTLAGVIHLQEDTSQALLLVAALEDPDPTQLHELHTTGPSTWDNWVLGSRLLGGARPGVLTPHLLGSAGTRLLDDIIEVDPKAVRALAEQLPCGARRHVLARLEPATLSDDDVIQLGLWDEHARRILHGAEYIPRPDTSPAMLALLGLAADGDTDLAAIATLRAYGSPHQQEIARQLQRTHEAGVVEEAVATDATLWPTIERLLGEHLYSYLRGGGHLPLRAWLAIRLARRKVVTERPFAARSVLGELRNLLRDFSNSFQAELLTANAYVAHCCDDARAAHRDANAARQLVRNAITEANYTLVVKSRAGRLSPHLTVGVDSYDPNPVHAADCAYRLNFRGGSDVVSDINWARVALRAEGSGPWFTYPLKPALYEPDHSRPGALRPEPQPVPRSTAPVDLDYLSLLREEACTDLVAAALDKQHSIEPAQPARGR